jgi:hypothetical protein
MIKNLLIIGLTFFQFYVLAQNFSVTYGFPEVTTLTGQTDPSNTPMASGLYFNSFNSFGTSLNPNASARFSFTGWPVGANNADNNYGNYGAVLSPTIYYEVTIKVDAGYRLDLSVLNFDIRRSGTGARTYCVRSSFDNFNSNLAAVTGTNSNLEIIPGDIFFWKYDSISTNNDQKGSRINFSSAYSSIADSLTLRFYAWNSESNGGSFSMDNVNFIGTIIQALSLSNKEEKFTSKEKMCMYPNPCSTGKLIVDLQDDVLKIDLFSAAHQIIELAFNKIGQGKTEVDLSELAPGVYNLRLLTQNKTVSKKLVITD